MKTINVKNMLRAVTGGCLLLFLTLILLNCKKDKYYEAAHNAGYATDFTSQGTTPKGIAMLGTEKLTNIQQTQIDEALDVVVSQAQEEYGSEIDDKAFKHTFYQYLMPRLECELSPEQRVPAFLVYGGWQYDGTIYDQYNPDGKYPAPVEKKDENGNVIKILYYKEDGYSAIYAAEAVLSFGTTGSNVPVGQVYVCNYDGMGEAFRNGAEHILLANGNTERVLDWFWSTLYHGTRGHPLIPRGSLLVEEAVPSQIVSDITRFKKGDTDSVRIDNVLLERQNGVNRMTVAVR